MSLTLYQAPGLVPAGWAYAPNFATGQVITPSLISFLQSLGKTGLWIDPQYPSLMSGAFKNITNFTVSQGAPGSIGYNGNVALNPNPVSTDSGTDGVQIFSDATAPCQGFGFRDICFTGANPNGVLHLGGRQRACWFDNVAALNTGSVASTVAAGSNAVNVNTFAGAGVLNVASAATFPAGGGTVLAQTTNGGQPGLALIAYTGTAAGQLTGCTTKSAAPGTLTTGNPVQLLQAALVNDSGLGSSSPNSEDQFFNNCNFATANAGTAIAWGTGDTGQKANDTLLQAQKTACAGGLASVYVLEGTFQLGNYYDRTPAASAPLYTLVNDGGIVVCNNGEFQNNGAAGQSVLSDGGAAVTVLQSMNVTQVTNASVITCTAGMVMCRGRTRIQGTVNIAGGTVDLADSAGQYGSASPASISGTAGTLVVAGSYPAPGSAPTVTGWTGTTSTAPM